MKNLIQGLLIRSVLSITLAFITDLRAQTDHPKPKLILQITVDQLRADLPLKVLDRLPEGGFKYLYENGVVYQNAHHHHANTETVVGHTTLATGAYPSEHGMIANLWFDKELGRAVYNVEDKDYPLIGTSVGVDKETEIDPSQAAAKTNGRSPKAIAVSTFSDELAMASNGKAKIFGVSVKDRGAITLAGHAGKAFWFSKSSGEFISSTYYYEDYPQWVSKWNAKKIYLKYGNTRWNLSHDPGFYMYKNDDDASYKTKFPGFGVQFPHEFGPADNPYFTTFLTLSPVGDELTLEFSKALIAAEELGKDDVTDFLAVSFSSTDYVGHIFGPSSLESEDNLIRLDRSLADLFQFIDQKIGLEQTLILLSADHGAVDAPAVYKKYGLNSGYIDPTGLEVQALNQQVKSNLSTDRDLITSYYHPYVYFNNEEISESGFEEKDVYNALKDYLESITGIKEAIHLSQLASGEAPASELYELVLNNYHPQRSGNIAIVSEPYWYVNDFDGLQVASTHGSPWAYDSHVPIIFVGAGIKQEEVSRKVKTVDIAVTLSNYMNIQVPSNARGAALQEVLEQKN